MNMNQLGKLQLIKTSAEDECVKYETDISMIVSEAKEVLFAFDFHFEEERTKAKVIIDGSYENKKGMVPFGIQVVDFGQAGFIMNFSLCDEENDEESFFICTAKFDTPLPQIGFIKQLLYHFDFNTLSVNGLIV